MNFLNNSDVTPPWDGAFKLILAKNSIYKAKFVRVEPDAAITALLMSKGNLEITLTRH
jgi:hypothetical protein